jgi:hypothetical protein
LVAGKSDISFAEAKQKWQTAIEDRKAEQDEYDRNSTVLARFSGKDNGAWYASGEAFAAGPTPAGRWDPLVEGPRLLPAHVAHSGTRAKHLRGALRSPDFTLTEPRLHYRMATTGATVWLIIDGFFVIEYHSLLFGGTAFGSFTGNEFQWQQQSGDLGKYIGHQAYIEILDNSDGIVAVDEIRLAKGDPPKLSQTSALVEQLVGNAEIDSWDKLAAAYEAAWENSVAAWRTQQLSAEQNQMLDWLMRWSLIDVSPALLEELTVAHRRIDQLSQSLPPPVEVLATADGSGSDAPIQIRGNPHQLGKTVPRGAPAALSDNGPPAISTRTSGRRELAEQILAADNPLTARVAANRVWHHLFGQGIVRTVDNFGVLGEPPSNPLLLDHLASSLVAEGWSLKRLVRKIVLSQTYRMSHEPVAFEDLDIENQLFHRANIRRLPAESIRDAVLAVSGQLRPTLYGASEPVHLTPFMQGRGRPGQSGPLDGNGRRSIYIETRRNFLPPFLLAFDLPQPVSCQGRRTTANVPAQALTMLNDPFVQAQAMAWAKRLLRDPNASRNSRVRRMFIDALGRLPSDDETAISLAFLDSQAGNYQELPDAKERELRLWTDLCHVVFNTKDFIYLK